MSLVRDMPAWLFRWCAFPRIQVCNSDRVVRVITNAERKPVTVLCVVALARLFVVVSVVPVPECMIRGVRERYFVAEVIDKNRRPVGAYTFDFYVGVFLSIAVLPSVFSCIFCGVAPVCTCAVGSGFVRERLFWLCQLVKVDGDLFVILDDTSSSAPNGDRSPVADVSE